MAALDLSVSAAVSSVSPCSFPSGWQVESVWDATAPAAALVPAGVLLPPGCRSLAELLAVDAPALALGAPQALDLAVEGLCCAIDLLLRAPSSRWLGLVLPPQALMSGGDLLGRWSAAAKANLAEQRLRVGRRLVLVLPVLPVDPRLREQLGAMHGLAGLWHEVRAAALRPATAVALERLLLAPSLIAGIDSGQRLQTQWRFLVHGAQALGLACTSTGVETASELAWLRRQGCREVSGALFGLPLSPEQWLAQAAPASCAVPE